jgi:NADPH2 dehydrogenase
MSSAPINLFQPFRLGNLLLQHRVVLAPLTRLRATRTEHVPTPLVKEYYSQRSKEPGSLLISEGAVVAPKASGMANLPGIWSDEQIKAWKEVSSLPV